MQVHRGVRVLPSVMPGTGRPGRALRLLVMATLLSLTAVSCQAVPPAAPAVTPPAVTPAANAGVPGHIFVINLENKGYDEVWGPGSQAPYLSQTLRSQGVLLSQYYGTAHNSTPDYLAQISGQPANPMTQDDCPMFITFTQTGTAGEAGTGQVVGDGCVYPASVNTIAGQLSAAGKSWRAYMEDMKKPCQHPAVGARDDHRGAQVGEQYATHHNPFVYFESITSSPNCSNDVVNFSALGPDLASVASTRNLSYITPNVCHDGHDSPCVDGSPGGLDSINGWLRQQIPAILDSPAYKLDGLLVITFDEADRGAVGPTGVVGGTDGGRVGALVLSRFTAGGTTSTRAYNHFSLLASLEDAFSLPRLGIAGEPGVNAFGADVYNAQP